VEGGKKSRGGKNRSCWLLGARVCEKKNTCSEVILGFGQGVGSGSAHKKKAAEKRPTMHTHIDGLGGVLRARDGHAVHQRST